MRVAKGSYCAAIGCYTNRGANPNIKLFTFPKDPKRCKKWAINTRRKDFDKKTMQHLNKNYFLCANHFCDSQFMNPALKISLVHDAIPTEFPNLPNKPPSLAMKRKLPMRRSPIPQKQKPKPKWQMITEVTDYVNKARPSQVAQNSKKEENVRNPKPRKRKSEPESEASDNSAGPSQVNQESTEEIVQSHTLSKKKPKPVIPSFKEITAITEYVADQNEEEPFIVDQDSEKYENVCRQLRNLKEVNRRMRLSKDKYKQFSKNNVSRKKALLQCKRYLPGRAFEFVSAQMNIAGHFDNGRQWNPDLNLLALSLYYYSPKAYSFLAGILMLPSKSALRKLIQNMQFQPGINDDILLALGKKAEQMSRLDRCCCICLDAMPLKFHLKFNENEELVTGLTDDGLTENGVIANSAISILVKGITSNWKQPIGYTFSSKGESSSSILCILQAFISNLTSIGFHVMCIVSDIGENFCELRKELQVTAEKPYFLHDNCRIFYIHDPPDLLKNTRGALKRYNVEFGAKRACWDDVVSVYKEDSSRAFKMCPGVTKNHIAISPFKEMKVELAAQVLSFSMAAAIETLHNLDKLPPNALGTAVFCNFFDQLFDCLNSSVKEDNPKKPYRSALRSSSVHWDFLESAPAMLKSFTFTDAKEVDCSNRVEFIEGWLLTIASLKGLYEDLKKMDGFTCLHTRNVNMEGAENFFGKIFQTNKNAGNLAPDQFKTAFRITCVNALMKPLPETNYSYDADALMKKMSSVIESMGRTNEITEEPILMVTQSNSSSDDDVQISRDK